MHIVDKIPFIFFIAMMGPILQIIYNPQLLLLLVLSPNTIKSFFNSLISSIYIKFRGKEIY